jgi:RimJ/RimL family protein N-acetyltransferase
MATTRAVPDNTPSAPESQSLFLSSANGKWELLPPAESRDEQCHKLFNDENTMLPYLSILCPMTWEDMKKRRQLHRSDFADGKSWCVDIVSTIDGELIGTSGFRSIDNDCEEAEWGTVIACSHQRQGICQEAFQLCLKHAKNSLSNRIKWMTASTLPDNSRMITFLAKMGFEPVTGGHDNWQKFRLSIVEKSKNTTSEEGVIKYASDMRIEGQPFVRLSKEEKRKLKYERSKEARAAQHKKVHHFFLVLFLFVFFLVLNK